jgi:hypothetical protein
MRPLTPEIQALTRVNLIMLAFLGLDWIVDSIKFENNVYNIAAALIQFSILRVIILARMKFGKPLDKFYFGQMFSYLWLF